MSATDQRSLGTQLYDSPGLLVRASWGALLLLRPDTGLDALDTTEPARAVIRILGARHLAELALELRHGPAWRRAGGVVDAIHAVTALGFAGLDHRWRRAAVTDAIVAAGFAVVGLTASDPKA